MAIAQNRITSIDSIPIDRHIYLMGHNHFNEIFKPSVYIDSLTTNSIKNEEELINYLYQNCGVRKFLIEVPICYQYFIDRFLEFGDSTIFHYFSGSTKFIGTLNYYKKLYSKYPDVKVVCYDQINPKYSSVVLNTIFLLTFYENFCGTCSGISENEISEKIFYYLDFHNDEKIFHGVLKEFSDCVWDFVYLKKFNDHNIKKALYYFLVNVKNNSQLLDVLRQFYGDNYELFIHLVTSYIESYENFVENKINKKLVIARENFLKNEVSKVIKIDNSHICITIGLFHVIQEFQDPKICDNLYTFLIAENYDIFAIANYYPGYDLFIPDFINEIMPSMKSNSFKKVNNNLGLLRN